MATTGNFLFYELLCFERSDVSLFLIKHHTIKVVQGSEGTVSGFNFSTTRNDYSAFPLSPFSSRFYGVSERAPCTCWAGRSGDEGKIPPLPEFELRSSSP
jgi:hypothetical protein